MTNVHSGAAARLPGEGIYPGNGSNVWPVRGFLPERLPSSPLTIVPSGSIPVRRMEAPDTVDWWEFVAGVTKRMLEEVEPDQWKTLQNDLRVIRERLPDLGQIAQFRQWADEVARYSFQAGCVLLEEGSGVSSEGDEPVTSDKGRGTIPSLSLVRPSLTTLGPVCLLGPEETPTSGWRRRAAESRRARTWQKCLA